MPVYYRPTNSLASAAASQPDALAHNPDASGGQAKLNVSKDSSFVGQKQYQAEKNVQQSCLLFPATQPTSTVSRFV